MRAREEQTGGVRQLLSAVLSVGRFLSPSGVTPVRGLHRGVRGVAGRG